MMHLLKNIFIIPISILSDLIIHTKVMKCPFEFLPIIFDIRVFERELIRKSLFESSERVKAIGNEILKLTNDLIKST